MPIRTLFGAIRLSISKNFQANMHQYSIYTSSNIFKKFIQTFYKLKKKNCIFLPKEGEYWKIKHGQNSLFAVIAKEMPLKVKYFEPSCKGSFQILNEKEYDVFIQDLDRKVDDPDTIRKGRRVFYMF